MYNISNESMAEILNEKVAADLTNLLKGKYPYTFTVEFQYIDYAFIHITAKKYDIMIGKDISNLVREASNCYVHDCFDDWYNDNYYKFENIAIVLVEDFFDNDG